VINVDSTQMIMFWLPKRRRRSIAALLLGAWLFAFAVSVAHACGLGLVDAVGPAQDRAPAMSVADNASDCAPPGCKVFCNDELPIVGKLSSLEQPIDGQPLLFSSVTAVGSLSATVATTLPRPSAPPPPSAPLAIRFLRLAL
jgi:hypothetical protein